MPHGHQLLEASDSAAAVGFSLARLRAATRQGLEVRGTKCTPEELQETQPQSSRIHSGRLQLRSLGGRVHGRPARIAMHHNFQWSLSTLRPWLAKAFTRFDQGTAQVAMA